MLAVVLAIIKAALMGLVIAAGVALLVAYVRKPRETLIFIGVMTLSGLASAQPLAAIIAVGVIGLVMGLTTRRPTVGSSKPDTDLLGH